MSQQSNVQIHEAVKEHYGAIASGASQSCCGDSGCGDGCSSSVLYDPALLEGLPVDVTGLSLG